MLQHSASAVYLPRRPRDSSLGPRTFSTTSIGGSPSSKTVHGVPLQTSLTSSTSTRLGLSDEETCSRSDASSCRTALMHRASSFLASRRGSSEAFEDALESLDPPHPSDELNNDYSSYAFALKAPPSDAARSQAGSPPRASVQKVRAEALKQQAASPSRDVRRTLICYKTSSMPSSSGRSSGNNREEEAVEEAREKVGESLVSTITPQPNTQGGASQQSKKDKGKAKQKERSAAAATVAETVTSSRCFAEGHSAASERDTGFSAFSRSPKSSSAPTAHRKDVGGAHATRAASQEARRVEVPRRAIGRYSSVPAFSAADRVRIDRFKEGLPECLSTQEAIKKQRKATEEERMRRREVGLPAAFGASALDCSTDLGEPVDWRSLLDAAGLGDVREDEITLEAEELHAKLQEFAPRSGPGWCLALLGCLWQWRM
ncbi:hypothetical protein, conserved [Eimeria maxima]|uniref:Uncharacterized protein n=1 Tax=Eimeria maxima TaxID=5804 RepID=U6M5M1_EIMMA|nr:hypothetical protein, conserved [Eimeria maxima]CDJ59326.1 hypothetical protein, conserved [Eimeria maxima]